MIFEQVLSLILATAPDSTEHRAVTVTGPAGEDLSHELKYSQTNVGKKR